MELPTEEHKKLSSTMNALRVDPQHRGPRPELDS
jgi:hypothetical protein